MNLHPRRSALFVPGSNMRAIAKARELPADTLIFDLEDGVAPEAKITARERVAAAIAEGGYGYREVVVRINGLETSWGKDDLAVACQAGANAVLVPKIGTARDVAEAASAMREAKAPERMRLWAMMETPLAVLNAREIAAASRQPGSPLEVLVIGTNDLAKAMGARLSGGRIAVLPALSTCVLAARAYRLAILDGVHNDIADAEGFRRECEQGRCLGMDGKTLIHPSQIDVCNELFAPSAAEIAWAHRILAAFDLPENAGSGAIAVDGKMVERLDAAAAADILAMARAIAERMP